MKIILSSSDNRDDYFFENVDIPILIKIQRNNILIF